MHFENIELAASGWAGVQWYNRHQFADGITDEDALCYLVEATPTRVHELIQIVKRQQAERDNLVLELAAERQRADMLLEQGKLAAAQVQAEQQRIAALGEELAAAKAAIPAQTGMADTVAIPLVSSEALAGIEAAWLDAFKFGTGVYQIKHVPYEDMLLQPVQQPAPVLSADDVQWITNDNAELGVKIGNQFFFLYKGHSLVYESGLHDDGRPMMYRHVFKCEFGECAHPINHNDYSKIGTVSLSDSDEWKAIDAAPVAAPVAMPEGWRVRKDPDGTVVVQKDGVGGYVAEEMADNIAASILHAFASDMLTAAPVPAASVQHSGRDAALEEAVAMRWPNGRGRYYYADMGDTVTEAVHDSPELEYLYLAAHPANVAQVGHTCESCGTHEVELIKVCHNSSCAQYAVEKSVHKGWAKK